MSKFEVRSLVSAFLDIKEGDWLIDIGAGTGSVSVQCAMHGARVTAAEREAEGIDLIRQNADKFRVEVETVHGAAPDCLTGLSGFNKAFIGGSGGRLDEIVGFVSANMDKGGIIAATFITLSNLVAFQEALKSAGFDHIETSLIQSSRVETKAELLKAQNPVFIVRGIK